MLDLTELLVTKINPKCTNARQHTSFYYEDQLMNSFRFSMHVQFPLPLSNIDPPTEFSSDYIGDPNITYIVVQESPFVPLICKAPLFHGIGTWANVTYLVQWFANGAPFWLEERCSGGGPCPQKDHIVFRLEGNKYKIGQIVSKQGGKPLSVEVLVAKNDYIIQDKKTSF